MAHTTSVKARISARQRERLNALCKTTGYTTSQMIRLLIEHADYQPRVVLGATLPVPNKDGDADKVLQTTGVSV
jgi:antitoxin component of RelBE/YafQ-DinJ toxin-antitoxin module